MEDAHALALRLADNALIVCRRYLSNGRREGGYWRVGDVENTPGRSLYVRLRGPAAGRWRDAATGEHGDLLDLIAAVQRHRSLADTLQDVRRQMGLWAPPSPTRQTSDTRDRSTSARRLFAGARSIAGTPASAYLRTRTITAAISPQTLRYHPACWYRPAPGELIERDAWPALIAAVTDLDGVITGIQRTWLDPGGAGKAAIALPRRSLGLIHGHGVRFGVAKGVLLAGEGLETVLSLRTVLPTFPVVAALSAGNLAALHFPPGLRRLYIAQDRDAAGERATQTLGERCRQAGVEPVVLEPRRDDFNSDLIAQGPHALLAAVVRQLALEDRARFAG